MTSKFTCLQSKCLNNCCFKIDLLDMLDFLKIYETLDYEIVKEVGNRINLESKDWPKLSVDLEIKKVDVKLNDDKFCGFYTGTGCSLHNLTLEKGSELHKILSQQEISTSLKPFICRLYPKIIMDNKMYYNPACYKKEKVSYDRVFELTKQDFSLLNEQRMIDALEDDDLNFYLKKIFQILKP